MEITMESLIYGKGMDDFGGPGGKGGHGGWGGFGNPDGGRGRDGDRDQDEDRGQWGGRGQDGGRNRDWQPEDGFDGQMPEMPKESDQMSEDRHGGI